MISDRANCDVRRQEKIHQAEDQQEIRKYTLPSDVNLKCENEENGRGCDNKPPEFNNYYNNFPLDVVKKEPEDSQCCLGVDYHQMQNGIPEFKEEKIDIKDHKPGWEVIGSNSGVGGCQMQVEHVEYKKEINSQDDLELVLGKSTSDSKNGMFNGNGPVQCSTSEDTEVYKCQECSYETRIKSNFTEHCDREHAAETEWYKCGECSFATSIKHSFIQHYKRKHNKSNLTLHFDHIHSKQSKVHKCQDCSYETKEKGNFTKHYKRKHSKEAGVYKCQDCSYETKIRDYLTLHLKYNHDTERNMYKCKECSYESKKKCHFNRHYECKHAKEGEVYKCPECSYETSIRCYFAEHYTRKHERKE